MKSKGSKTCAFLHKPDTCVECMWYDYLTADRRKILMERNLHRIRSSVHIMFKAWLSCFCFPGFAWIGICAFLAVVRKYDTPCNIFLSSSTLVMLSRFVVVYMQQEDSERGVCVTTKRYGREEITTRKSKKRGKAKVKILEEQRRKHRRDDNPNRRPQMP